MFLRRLRARIVRAHRVLIPLVLVAFASPALAGPLVHCLEGAEGPRIVAAASHCPSMAEAAPQPVDPVHLPVSDEAVGTGPGAGGVVASVALQAPGVVIHFGGLLPPILDLLPSRDDAYRGSGPPTGASTSGPAGAAVGRSVRLQI